MDDITCSTGNSERGLAVSPALIVGLFPSLVDNILAEVGECKGECEIIAVAVAGGIGVCRTGCGTTDSYSSSCISGSDDTSGITVAFDNRNGDRLLIVGDCANVAKGEISPNAIIT